MREDTILQLKKISTPKQFAKEEYICYEGQPGNEMYIILKGSVGVFVTSPIGTLTRVATIDSGDFFGEMAIFDNLPRSASCIALEDTITVVVTKENLQVFLENCPDIAGQMLEKMSGRIRKLDDELYRNNRFVKNRHVPRFMIPVEYQNGHIVRAAHQKPQYVTEFKQACPICGKAVSVVGLKRNILEENGFDTDGRITYNGCDPLWTEVITCSRCHYTNHYLRFFAINNFEYELVGKLLEKEHKPIVESRIERRSDYDILVMKYLQAININEHIDPGANSLIGGLWRNLYWLSKDISDTEFAKFCAKKTIEKYQAALEADEISDVTAKTAIAHSLACMMVYLGDYKNVMKYIDIAMECPDERIQKRAAQVKAHVEKRIEN